MSGYIALNAALITRKSKDQDSGRDIFFLDGKYSDRIFIDDTLVSINKSSTGSLFSLFRVRGSEEAQSKLLLLLQNELSRYHRKIDFLKESGNRITSEVTGKIEAAVTAETAKGTKDAALESMSVLTFLNGKVNIYSNLDNCVFRMRNGSFQSFGRENSIADYKAKDMFLICDGQAISVIPENKLEELMFSYDNPEVIVDEITREIRLNGYDEEITALLVRIEATKAIAAEEEDFVFTKTVDEYQEGEIEDMGDRQKGSGPPSRGQERKKQQSRQRTAPKRESQEFSEQEILRRKKENIITYVVSGLTIALLILVISVIASSILNQKKTGDDTKDVLNSSQVSPSATDIPIPTPENSQEPGNQAGNTGDDGLLPTPDSSGSIVVIDNTGNSGTDVNTTDPTPVPTMPPVSGSGTGSESGEYDTYTVKSGDTLMKISREFYGTESRYKEIMTINNIEDENKIMVGQKLKIPKK